MENISINMIPYCILEKLFSLKEVNMFVLPNGYILGNSHYNNWKKIIIQKLTNINKRHKGYLVVEITTFNLIDKSIYCKEYILQKNSLLNKIIYHVERNTAISIIIKNYSFEYGYLIIPGYKLKNN